MLKSHCELVPGFPFWLSKPTLPRLLAAPSASTAELGTEQAGRGALSSSPRCKAGAVPLAAQARRAGLCLRSELA